MKKRMVSMAIMLLLFSGWTAITAYAAEPESLASAGVAVAQQSYVFTGAAIEPSVTVTIGAKTLQAGADYAVSYADNVHAGTATVTVQGLGAYTDMTSATFTIKPRSLADEEIVYTRTQYAYPNVAPAYQITYQGNVLTEGKDYTVDVSNYARTGIKSAKFTVKGIGDYTGTKTLKEHVYPNAVSDVKVQAITTQSLTLSWAAQSQEGITGYEVYTCAADGTKEKLCKRVTANTLKISDLKAGSTVNFKVRAYTKSDDKTVRGAFSPVVQAATRPEKVALSSVTKSKKGTKLHVQWKSVNCSGYIIEYTTDKTFKKGVKTVTVNKAKAEKKSIAVKASSKKYYARVRAVQSYNNGNNVLKGKWSAKISSEFSKVYQSYTTRYVNNANRTKNLRLACKAIDGTVVAPGETFSFNKTVGKRTSARGFRPAPVFVGTHGHENGVGGGVCQVASTMFNTALYANFQIVERHQHSQRVTYVPLGRDAAIYWGSCDFKFKNTSDYPVKIKMTCQNGKLTCKFYVSSDVTPKKVNLSVSRSGKNFTLRRKVGGKTNYTTRSYY